MAEYFGVNATLAAAGSTGSNIIGQSTVASAVKAIYEEYEASALANASTIKMGTLLPVGARILHVRFMWDDMGSTVTMKVGDAGDDDRYVVAATSLSTANGTTDINAIAGFGYVITGTSDTQIIITVAGVWSGTLKMLVEYAI